MSQPLSEYSKDAIGRAWTAADHRYLMEQLRRIDELAQDLWRYSRRNQSPGGQIRALRLRPRAAVSKTLVKML